MEAPSISTELPPAADRRMPAGLPHDRETPRLTEPGSLHPNAEMPEVLGHVLALASYRHRGVDRVGRHTSAVVRHVQRSEAAVTDDPDQDVCGSRVDRVVDQVRQGRLE